MLDFLKHELTNRSQDGFLKQRPCLITLLFLDNVTKWIDKVSPVDVVYLNFQQTFDEVPHQRLLVKMNCGLSGKMDRKLVRSQEKERISRLEIV